MTLSNYVEPYLELHSSNRITKAAIRALVKHFGEHDYTHCTSEDWLGFFKSIPRASVATLRRYRSSIVTFLLWIDTGGLLDVASSIASLKELDLSDVVEEAKSSLLRGYFGSYDDMMDAAEHVFRQNGGDLRYAPILYSMITLVWYGIPWRSALEIRKAEVQISDDLCVIQGRYRIRHERAIRYIRSYLQAALVYDVNNRSFAYRPSDRLFRSSMASEITEESMRNRLAQFNILAANEGVHFSFDKIRESAVFVRSYVLITNMGMKVTPIPHPALIVHFSKMFEFTASEISEDRYRNEAWELFYRWCEKFRVVTPM